MNLQSRLEKLEAKASNEREKITAIFRVIIRTVDGKSKQAPLVGWRTINGEDVMRFEGESNESLKERAISIATAKAGNNHAPRLIQIVGE